MEQLDTRSSQISFATVVLLDIDRVLGDSAHECGERDTAGSPRHGRADVDGVVDGTRAGGAAAVERGAPRQSRKTDVHAIAPVS